MLTYGYALDGHEDEWLFTGEVYRSDERRERYRQRLRTQV